MNHDTRTARVAPAPPPVLAPPAEPEPAPVFVDMTGRRRRLIRRMALGSLAIVGAYGIAIILSFLGGPVPPNALLPLPDAPKAATSTGKPNAPEPAASGSAVRAGSGTVGGAPGSGSATGAAGTSAPLSSVSPAPTVLSSPTGNLHTASSHATKSASPGPSRGHGR